MTAPSPLPAGFQGRRVGFRDGTDDELRALHAVEIPVAKECGWGRMPAPLESYVAFARNLPSQFGDHAWIVEDDAAVPVAAGFCWSNAAGDERVMECGVFVLPECRRRGIASHLLARISEEAVADGRSLLLWSTFDRVPAGEALARRIDGRVARRNRTSDLVLAAVDWALVERWARAERARAQGYSLEVIVGPFPDARRADAATFHRIMQTAPRDDLEAGDVMIDGDFVAELDRALVESGRDRWTLFVRDRGGRCVGGTEVTYEPWHPGVVHQQNTGIDRAHRGAGLAKWAKATMLERVRQERPSVERIRTDNAFSNEPMLAINDALGFQLVSARTEWQAEVDDILSALA